MNKLDDFCWGKKGGFWINTKKKNQEKYAIKMCWLVLLINLAFILHPCYIYIPAPGVVSCHFNFVLTSAHTVVTHVMKIALDLLRHAGAKDLHDGSGHDPRHMHQGPAAGQHGDREINSSPTNGVHMSCERPNLFTLSLIRMCNARIQ